MLTLAVLIQNQIMEDICSGELQPGTRLEEKDLAPWRLHLGYVGRLLA
jgi:DNA-binding GntR family transcriptional regulator